MAPKKHYFLPGYCNTMKYNKKSAVTPPLPTLEGCLIFSPSIFLLTLSCGMLTCKVKQGIGLIKIEGWGGRARGIHHTHSLMILTHDMFSSCQPRLKRLKHGAKINVLWHSEVYIQLCTTKKGHNHGHSDGTQNLWC